MTGMRRRDFVKAIMAASVSARSLLSQQAKPVGPSTPPAAPPAAPTAPGPVPWMRGLTEVKPLQMTPLVADAVAQTNTHFFTERQFATLRRLCEILLPPLNGYPGATDAGTPEFLDFLVGMSPADRQRLYQSGLDRLDADAKKQFAVSFEGVNAAQADQLLHPWLRTWMNDHPPTEPYAQFINVAHSDIRTATINSQPWSEAAKSDRKHSPEEELYWFPIDPDLRHDTRWANPRTLPRARRS